MDGNYTLLGYGASTLVGLAGLGLLVLAGVLWRRPATDPGEPMRLPRAGGAGWLQLGLLVFAGTFLLGRSLFALLLG